MRVRARGLGERERCVDDGADRAGLDPRHTTRSIAAARRAFSSAERARIVEPVTVVCFCISAMIGSEASFPPSEAMKTMRPRGLTEASVSVK